MNEKDIDRIANKVVEKFHYLIYCYFAAAFFAFSRSALIFATIFSNSLSERTLVSAFSSLAFAAAFAIQASLFREPRAEFAGVQVW